MFFPILEVLIEKDDCMKTFSITELEPLIQNAVSNVIKEVLKAQMPRQDKLVKSKLDQKIQETSSILFAEMFLPSKKNKPIAWLTDEEVEELDEQQREENAPDPSPELIGTDENFADDNQRKESINWHV